MPFLFKLSRRVARVRTPVVLLATAALVGACDSTDRGLSDPTLTRPSFLKDRMERLTAWFGQYLLSSPR